MGLSSSKQTNKPVYNKQIEGAGNTLTSAYGANAPKIQQVSDTITGLMPDIVKRYQEGDPAVNAASAYNTDVLSGRYLDEGNPHLQAVIDDSNNDITNQLQASLGLRGLTGGSSYADLISRNIAKNTTGLRYSDYSAERDRMGSAAAGAPGLAAAREIPLASILATGDAAQDPLKAAVGYAGGLGGLLGQYQTVKTKQALGPILAQMASNVAAAYAGGG